MTQSERILVLAAQAGNKRALEALFRAYQASLLGFAIRLCGNRSFAEDAVQDAWLSIARNVGGLKDPTRFRAWAFKAVRWRLADLARRPEEKHQSYDAIQSEVDPTLAQEAPEKHATSGQIIAMLNRLPLNEREVVHLFYLEEMPLAEIAGIQSVPIGTVKSRLNRARKALQETATRDTTQDERNNQGEM